MSRMWKIGLFVVVLGTVRVGWAQLPEARIAASYSRLLNELDAETPGDAEALLERAPEILKRFGPRLEELEAAAGNVLAPADSIVRLGKDKARLVNKNEIIPLVQMLGELSLKVAAANNWAKYWLRDENKKFFEARGEAQARNLEEIKRVYIQYQQALLARETAMQQLNGILSGRLKIVADGTGGRRDATYAESLAYMANLQGTALGDIYIVPPHKTIVKDLFDKERLEFLKKQQPKLLEIQYLVDGELGRLAGEHLKQVKAILDSGDKGDKKARAVAVLSLGWWNKKGVALALASIDDKTVEIQNAGITALSRLRLDQDALNHLKKHKLPLVRSAVIELFQNRVQDLLRPQSANDSLLQSLRPLLMDQERSVRLEAYGALDRIAELRNDQSGEVLKLAFDALKSLEPKIALDAILWIDKHGRIDDVKVAQERQKSLARLEKYHKEEASQAAPGAGPG